MRRNYDFEAYKRMESRVQSTLNQNYTYNKIFIKLMKIGPINFHNDSGYKTVTRIHCKNEYLCSYINKSNYCINELTGH